MKLSRYHRFRYWLADDSPEWLADLLAHRLCWLTGHTPIQDHCGKPEHDHCLWCGALTPGQAKR